MIVNTISNSKDHSSQIQIYLKFTYSISISSPIKHSNLNRLPGQEEIDNNNQTHQTGNAARQSR
jgi:hypothetical protein